MEFTKAKTLDEALAARAEWGTDGQLLAGGTDVMVQFQHGEIHPSALIHIERVPELSGVSTNGRTTLGALTTHRTLATDAVLVAAHPALAASAATVGGWQTQAVGTLGGNVCNASPAADTVPALLVADAHLTLRSADGERRLRLDDFILDRRRTALGPDELLTTIDLAPIPAGSAETYLKLGRRGAMEVAVVGLAVRLAFGDDGAVTDARIAVCSLAPSPLRVADAEAALVGSALDADSLDAAAAALLDTVSPIDDARASAHYRRRALRGLLGRAAEQCVAAHRHANGSGHREEDR